MFFYDPLGAQFQAASFAASGSGSPSIRAVLSHLENWGNPKPGEMDQNAAILLANRLLITAATFDTATGGIDPKTDSFATIKLLTPAGIQSISEEEQRQIWEEHGR